MSHRLPAVIGALLAVVLALPGAAAANERIWTLLKGGGQLVLVRHAITTPGVGDPPGMRLDDRSENRTRQVGEMTAIVGERRGGGTLVLVSHGSTISALTASCRTPARWSS